MKLEEISVRRNILIVFFLVVSSLSLLAQENRPNIVLILAEDLRFEFVCANGGT